MRRRLPVLLLFLLPLVTAGRAAAEPPAPPISGIVSHLQQPVADALIVFYNLGDTSLTRSRTASDGTFVVPSAPIGVYDLVAYKKGFLPSLVRIWHPSLTGALSAVHIQLSPRNPSLDGDRKAPPMTSVWELRDRVPADVLREISLEDESVMTIAGRPGDRIRIDRAVAGEVRSVADVSSGDTSLSRTAVGVRGGLSNGWTYNLRGDYAAVSDSAGVASDSHTTGNAAGIAIDLAPSSVDHVTVTTRRNTLSFHDDRPASLQAHAVSWSRGEEEGYAESVAARYVDETNLYRATSAGTSFFPIASRTWEVKARYARPAGDSPGTSVSLTYRHREGTIGASAVGSNGAMLALSAPDADLSASASARLSSRSEVEGGVVARYLSGGYGIAPRIAARYRVGDQTYLFVRGLYRVAESTPVTTSILPLVASIQDANEATSRKGISAGLERSAGDYGKVRIEASSQRINEAVRAFFEGDFLTDFDSVYLFDGNLFRQYQASVTQRLSDTVSGTLSVRYGTIDGAVAPDSASTFGITGNRGRFWTTRAGVEVLPTRTGIAVLFRGARQQLATGAGVHLNESDKIAISIAQDLSVIGLTPFGSDCKLLMALESVRSTATIETETAPLSNRLLGGLAIAF